MKRITNTFILVKEPCRDKNIACPSYMRMGYARHCKAEWFVGDSGRYGCKKSCGLC